MPRLPRDTSARKASKPAFKKVRDTLLCRQLADHILSDPTLTKTELVEITGASRHVINRVIQSGELDKAVEKRLTAAHNAAGVDIAGLLATSAKARGSVLSMSVAVIRALHDVVEAGAEAARRGWKDEDGNDLTTWIKHVEGHAPVAIEGVPDRKTWLAAATTLARVGVQMLRLHEARALGIAEEAAGEENDRPVGEVRMRLEGFDPAPTVRRFETADIQPE